MLDEVEIVSVAAKEAPASWSAQDLVNFDYDGDIENGLLEVSFKDIPTDFDFDGYIIKAVPGDDDPGNSYKFVGEEGYTSPSLIARPSVVGSTVTEILNLEPGTKYYVTIYAVNHNTVQISPPQRPQDSSSATTLLSAPFLGALDWKRYLYVADGTAGVSVPAVCRRRSATRVPMPMSSPSVRPNTVTDVCTGRLAFEGELGRPRSSRGPFQLSTLPNILKRDSTTSAG